VALCLLESLHHTGDNYFPGEDVALRSAVFPSLIPGPFGGFGYYVAARGGGGGGIRRDIVRPLP
jgi:hypothetical protein